MSADLLTRRGDVLVCDQLDAYVSPVSGGEYAALAYSSRWSLTAPSREEVEAALTWLLAQRFTDTRLRRTATGYRHEATGLTISRGAYLGGGMWDWRLAGPGWTASIGTIRAGRELLRTLAARGDAGR